MQMTQLADDYGV